MVVQGKGAWKGTKSPSNNNNNNNNNRSNNVHTLNDNNNNNNNRSRSDDDDQPIQHAEWGSNHHDLSDFYGSNNKPIPEYSGRPPRHGISFSEMFFPWHKLASITTIILILNVIYFIIILVYAGVKMPPVFASSNRMGGPSAEVLKVLQAKWTPDIVRGHIWRLFLPIFMHSGILHIVMNCFFFSRYGWLTEVRFNSWVMLLIYLFAGIGSNAASALLAPGSVSCGASGALFGIMAANLYFVIRHWKQLRNAFCEFLMIIIIFVMNLLIGFLQPGSGADNWAHMFGFFYGFLAAIPLLYFWRNDVNKKREKLYRIIGAIAAVVLWALMIGLIWIRK